MSSVVTIQEPASAEAFAALALSVLLEQVADSTGDLLRLREALETAGREPLPLAEQQELARACAELEDRGWLFGLWARELGSDVLFERRERHGLERALELVRTILARDGTVFALPATPELDSSDERASTLCAVVARCVHAAHAAHPPPVCCFARRAEETSLRFTGTPGPALRRALREGERRLAGSLLRETRVGVEFVFPRNCAVWP